MLFVQFDEAVDGEARVGFELQRAFIRDNRFFRLIEHVATPFTYPAPQPGSFLVVENELSLRHQNAIEHVPVTEQDGEGFHALQGLELGRLEFSHLLECQQGSSRVVARPIVNLRQLQPNLGCRRAGHLTLGVVSRSACFGAISPSPCSEHLLVDVSDELPLAGDLCQPLQLVTHFVILWVDAHGCCQDLHRLAPISAPGFPQFRRFTQYEDLVPRQFR